MTEDYQAQFEKEIRELIGAHLAGKLNLEAVGNAKLRYTRELNLENYRKFFPEGDSHITLYLGIKEYYPELAIAMATLYKINEKKEEALTKQNFDLAAEIRDIERGLESKLVEIVKEIRIPKIKAQSSFSDND